MGIDNLFQDLFQLFLSYVEIHFQHQLISLLGSVHKSQILRQDLIEQEPAQRGLHILPTALFRPAWSCCSAHDSGLQCNISVFIGQNRLIQVLEPGSLSLASRSFLGQVVDTQHHILRGNCHRASVGGLQQVIGRQQQEPALCLRFHRQGQMHSHLVSIEVGVERGTNQRMQLDGFTFHQDGLKCLDTQTMQGRRTVQHYRMLFDYLLQHIPDLGLQLSPPFSWRS